MIKTSLELYNNLCENAGLNIKDDFYDTEFNKQLFSALAIKSKEELGKITIELFVQTFFNELYPYSLMMSDILKFYEEAESKSNGNNINVTFNFDDINNNLQFDLKHFKKYSEILHKTILEYTKPITYNDLERIRSLFREEINKSLYHNYKSIEDSNKWPKELLIENVHHIQDSETKQIVLRLRQIINDILRFVREESKSYSEFIADYSKRVSNENILKTSNIEILTSSLTGMISDRILDNLYNRLNNSIMNGSIYTLKNDLKNIFKLDNRVAKENYIKTFEEYLSLPIWKARHEIYSVWVSIKIKEATEYLGPQINTNGGKLEYGFKAYNLISYNTLPVKIDLYSELKLSHDKNISDKRIENVQPDYTLVRKTANPLNEDAILVVECKQYKKSSKKNFAEAIIDYANAHPNAHIFLVNYGNITQSVLSAIQKHNIQKTRYTLVDHFEPTNNASLKLFTDKVKNNLNVYYLKPNTIYIELSWNNNFEDLDLELEFKVDQTKHYVNYRYREFINKEFKISLNHDVIRNGTNHDLNDKEIIEIKKFKDYDYGVRVTKFSNEENFHKSDAVVVIRDNNRVYKRFEISKDDIINDSVWNVFSFKNVEDLLTKMI